MTDNTMYRTRLSHENGQSISADKRALVEITPEGQRSIRLSSSVQFITTLVSGCECRAFEILFHSFRR